MLYAFYCVPCHTLNFGMPFARVRLAEWMPARGWGFEFWSVQNKMFMVCFSTAHIPNTADFVSVSEDRTLKVWTERDSTASQTLMLPSETPWSVIALPNKDVAVCSKYANSLLIHF